jgi:hypothetical protein
MRFHTAVVPLAHVPCVTAADSNWALARVMHGTGRLRTDEPCSFAEAVPDQAAAETADRALLTPVLRTVGNVAAGGGAAAVSQLLHQLSGNLLSVNAGCQLLH